MKAASPPRGSTVSQRCRALPSALILAGGACLLLGANAAAASFQALALTGQVAPGGGGGAWEVLGLPVLNGAGNVAFAGRLNDTDEREGLWLRTGTTTAGVLVDGAAAPGIAGGVVSSPANLDLTGTYGDGEPRLNRVIPFSLDESGRLAFLRTVTQSGAATQALFSGTAAAPGLVAREDQAVSTGLPDVLVSSFGAHFQTAGGTVYQAFYRGADDPADTQNPGIFRKNGSTVTALATLETAPAGYAVGTRYSYATIGNAADATTSLVSANRAGKVGFVAEVNDATLGETIPTVYVERTALTRLTKAGDAATGATGSTFGPGTGEVTFSEVTMGVTGHIGFKASVEGTNVTDLNDTGIWRDTGTGTALTLLVREGSAATGLPAGVVWNDFLNRDASSVSSRPVLGTGDRLSIIASLRDDSADGTKVTEDNDTGLWGSASGSLALIAREGAAPVGLPSTAKYGDFADAVFSTSDSGFVAFTADATLANGDAVQGLWAQGPTRALQLVLSSGSLFSVGANDLRTIREIFLAGETTRANPGSPLWEHSPLDQGFNDNFQLAFQLTFTDGTQGIFLAQVPEPQTAALLLAGLPLALARRRGKRG